MKHTPTLDLMKKMWAISWKTKHIVVHVGIFARDELDLTLPSSMPSFAELVKQTLLGILGRYILKVVYCFSCCFALYKGLLRATEDTSFCKHKPHPFELF